MKHREHSYRSGIAGRSFAHQADDAGGSRLVARLECSRCPRVGSVNLSVRLPPDQIDKKFKQSGWQLDPHMCGACQRAVAKEKKMTQTAKPSPTAMRAQAQMLTALQTHFDADKGAFAAGWDDKRIAADTGLAVSIVTEYREAVFGVIKEPTEIAALRADISTLERLARDNHSSIGVEIASLRSRLGEISAKWAKA